jgi:hypothetical protein
VRSPVSPASERQSPLDWLRQFVWAYEVVPTQNDSVNSPRISRRQQFILPTVAFNNEWQEEAEAVIVVSYSLCDGWHAFGATINKSTWVP